MSEIKTFEKLINTSNYDAKILENQANFLKKDHPDFKVLTVALMALTQPTYEKIDKARTLDLFSITADSIEDAVQLKELFITIYSLMAKEIQEELKAHKNPNVLKAINEWCVNTNPGK